MAVRLFGLISLTLAVAACAPVAVTYFKPSAPNAEYKMSTCAGWAGPEDRVLLAGPEGIVIGVEAYTTEELSALLRATRREVGIEFSIAVFIPSSPPMSVRFASGTFLLTDELTKVVHEYGAEDVLDFPHYNVLLDGPNVAVHYRDPRLAGRMRRIDIREPLSGTSRKEWHGPPPRWFGKAIDHPYYIVLSFRNVQSKQFRLRLPPVLVGREAFEFPEIGFREVTEWIGQSLNC